MPGAHASSRAGTAWASACAIFLGAGPALAQTDRAERLFEEGLRAMLEGDLETGCDSIAESLRLEFTPGTLFTLAECRAKQGKIATAVERYGEFIEAYERLDPDDKERQRARYEVSVAERKSLDTQIPTIRVLLPKWAPKGTVVIRDGVELDRRSVGRPLRVDPGEHVFVTQAPGDPATERRTHIERAQHLSMMLPVIVSPEDRPAIEALEPAEEPPEPVTETPPTRERPASSPVPIWIAGGIGTVGVVVGSIAGVIAIGERESIFANCEERFCTPEGKASADRAQTAGAVSTAGFALGIAGLATAVVLLLNRDDDPESTAVKPIVIPHSKGALIGAASAW